MSNMNRDAVVSLALNLAVWIVHAVGLYMVFFKVDSGTAHDLLPMIRIGFGIALLMAVAALVVGIGAGRKDRWTPAPILAVVISILNIGLTVLYLIYSILVGMMI